VEQAWRPTIAAPVSRSYGFVQARRMNGTFDTNAGMALRRGRMTRRRSAIAALAALMVGTVPFGAVAQVFPNKPIRFIVGFPPGGGGDVVARIVATPLSEVLGQPVIVENKPGATGTLAAGIVAKSSPDGYTLLVGATSTNAIAPALYPQLTYDNERDLVGVSLLASFPHVVAVTPTLKVNSLKELVAYDRDHPDELTFSSAGNGSTPHLAGEMFNKLANTHLRHIPYKGAGQSISDLLAGRISVSFDTTATIISYLNTGGLRTLAIASPQRFAGLPNIPTAAEAGLAGFEMSTWVGVFAPTATPKDIVDKLNAAMNAVLQRPDIRHQLKTQIGCDDTVTPTAESFQRLVQRDITRFSPLIKELNVRLD
jgi:tripartite-type tricarboxylate transporter receptor subunit TctC